MIADFRFPIADWVRRTAALAAAVCLSLAALGAQSMPKKVVRRVTSDAFVTTNGRRFFNRPLYGSTRPGFVPLGDRPHVSLMCIAGNFSTFLRCGDLVLGAARDGTAKWLHDFDHVEARYEPGLMYYTLRDPALGGAALRMDVAPLDEGDGYVVRLRADRPVEILGAFGGILNLTHAEKDHYQGNATIPGGIDPARCRGTTVKAIDGVGEVSATLRPQRREDAKPVTRAVYGMTNLEGTLLVGDAASAVKAADALRQVGAGEQGAASAAPIILGRASLLDTRYILVCATNSGSPDGGTLARTLFADPAALFDRCERHFRDVASRFVVETPDDLLNAGVKSVNNTMDSLYCNGSFLHGSIRWGWLGLCGWRGAYGASICGTHDRMASHLAYYAKRQSTKDYTRPKPEPRTGYCTQARDSVYFSRGRIMTGVYNMTELWLDFVHWHTLWSGDREFLKATFPHVRDAVAFQKRALDPDGDGLYENFANTYISDAHWYNGGGCTQSSAFTYRANLLAAEAARLAGEDPKPFLAEAAKIKKAMDAILWVRDKGFYAEFKDLLGLQRRHESPELASVYHPIDFYVADMFQAYQSLRYTQWGLPNRSFDIEGEQAFPPNIYKRPASYILPQPLRTREVWSSNWYPTYPTVREIGTGEIANLAQCYFRIGHGDEGFRVLKSIFWYMLKRQNPGALPHWMMDGYTGDMEHCDGVGSTMRAVAEGLFGLYPDLAHDHLTVQPGFPADWTKAACRNPDLGYSYVRDGATETVVIRTTKPTTRRLRLRARSDGVRSVTLDGKPAKLRYEAGVGCAFVVVDAPKAQEATIVVTSAKAPLPTLQHQAVAAVGHPLVVRAKAGKITGHRDPQGVLKNAKTTGTSLRGTIAAAPGHHTLFVELQGTAVRVWAPVDVEVREPLEIVEPRLTDKAARATFRLRNNTSSPVKLSGVVRLGGVERPLNASVPAGGTAEPIAVPITKAMALSPGRNPLAVEAKAGKTSYRLAADVTALDLFEKAPARKAALEPQPLDIAAAFNDEMANIFNHKYLTPRSPHCSLQQALNGFQQWCGAHGERIKPFRLDTSLLTKRATFTTPQGIPFATATTGRNVAFVSRYDNFPNELAIPVGRSARKVYLLIAGSTTPMESGIVNAQAVLHLAGGRTETLDLVNPDNFDMCATKLPLYGPYPRKANSFPIGADCRAQLFDIPLGRPERIERLELRCLSNDIVVGLLGVTTVE